jgi:hypothetical protein
VDDHRIEKKCPCDAVTTGVFTTEVKSPLSFGPRPPDARTAAAFIDVFHFVVSTGCVSSPGRKTSRLSADTVAVIKQAVTVSTVAHLDEAGLGVAGHLAGLIAGPHTHGVLHRYEMGACGNVEPWDAAISHRGGGPRRVRGIQSIHRGNSRFMQFSSPPRVTENL